MNNKYVIFDFDDTLSPNAHNFIKVKKKVENIFKEIFGNRISIDYIMNKLDSIDIENVKKGGFTRQRFGMSIVETYFELCEELGEQPNFDNVKKLYETGDSVHDKWDPLYEGALEVVKNVINKGYKVLIFTAGSEVFQLFKIYKTGLEDVVGKENIIVTRYKNEKAYKEHFESYGLENCIMVGNSLTSDISPALNVGMKAIYVHREIVSWNYDFKKVEGKYITINKIEDVLGAIEIIANDGKVA